jgi:large subunit ribosomal protein L25
MEEIMSMKELNVELRTKTGKGISRQLRIAGRIPGIVYGKGFNSTAISVDQRELLKTVAGEDGQNALISLNGAGDLKGAVVIVASMLLDPIKGTPRHIDLHKVNMEEKVRVEVKLRLKGTAKGVKDGGMLEFVKHTVELECLPALIPGHIDVDVTNLTVGHSIHVSDLQLPANVRLLDDQKAAIVSVIGKYKEEEAPAEA